MGQVGASCRTPAVLSPLQAAAAAAAVAALGHCPAVAVAPMPLLLLGCGESQTFLHLTADLTAVFLCSPPAAVGC